LLCRPEQTLPARVPFASGGEGSEIAMRVACGHCHSILQTALAGDEPDIALPVTRAEGEREGEQGALTEAAAVKAPQPAKTTKATEMMGMRKQGSLVMKKQFLTLIVECLSGRNLAAKDEGTGTSDPYCKIKVKEGRTKQKEKTKVISKTRDPAWNETFTFKSCVNRVAIEGDPRMQQPGVAPTLNWDVKLKMSCYDQDRMGEDKHMGVIFVPLAGLPLNRRRDIWLPLTPKVEGQHVSGDIRIRLLLTDE